MAEQFLPGIYRIPLRIGPITWVNAFPIVRDEVVLVDTGLPKRTRAFLKAIEGAGRRPFDIRHILITHHHVDHTGGLAELSRATEARVYVHPLDAPIVRGDVPIPGPSVNSMGAKVMGSLSRLLYPGQLEHVGTSHQLQDGEELPVAGGLRVIHTPGHTAGHVSFLMPDRGGVLFAGDAAGNLGRVGPPLGAYTEDMDEAKRSIAKLAQMDFEIACFGHGRVVKGKAATRFRRLVERLAG